MFTATVFDTITQGTTYMINSTRETLTSLCSEGLWVGLEGSGGNKRLSRVRYETVSGSSPTRV